MPESQPAGAAAPEAVVTDMDLERALTFSYILLLLPMSACGPRTEYSEAPHLLQLRAQGNELFRSAEYAQAARIYRTGVETARNSGDTRSAIRFLNNLGSVNHQLLRIRDAAQAYLEARTMATQAGDLEMVAATSFNLSSVYLELGEVNSAREAAERGLDVPPSKSAKFRSSLLIQLALIRLRAADCDGSTSLLREAIDTSPDLAGEAQAWNELGNTLLECGDGRKAEDALLEAYRTRKLSGDPRLHYSYESLAELRLSEHHPAAALTLLDRALEDAADLGPSALWRPLATRGRANRMLGRPDDAYRDLRESLRHLRSWRAGVLPADSFRIATEVEVHDVYTAFIETAAERYRETGRQRFAEEAFEAAEDGRAASLRALWAGSDRPRQLPDEYWATLSQLRRAETQRLRGEPDGGEAERLRAQLAEMEASAGLAVALTANADEAVASRLLATARQAVAADEAYLAFHTGQSGTSVWAVTRDGFEMAGAPGESELEQRVAQFVESIRGSKPQSAELGERLFAELFGKLSPRLLGRTRWTIAPDGPLFDLPFTALRQGGRYLVETHSVRLTPGISFAHLPAARKWTEAFVGVGDPIYNRADPRRKRAAGGGGGGLELPRLLGSGREVQSCAGVWQSHGRRTVLLVGADATRDRLAQALAGRPAVVHVAGHMLFPDKGTARGMLALSMQKGSEVELVSDTEVVGMGANVGLVVLNGCSSGRAPILPGAGLMGMTRAWLASGAAAVIATRWAAPDQSAGALFEALYREYLERPRDPAVPFGDVLRVAQVAELRAGGTRADPARWASYFCVERN